MAVFSHGRLLSLSEIRIAIKKSDTFLSTGVGYLSRGGSMHRNSIAACLDGTMNLFRILWIFYSEVICVAVFGAGVLLEACTIRRHHTCNIWGLERNHTGTCSSMHTPEKRSETIIQ